MSIEDLDSMKYTDEGNHLIPNWLTRRPKDGGLTILFTAYNLIPQA